MFVLSRVRLFATPWSGAHQAPLSGGFSRQEYWSGLPFASPGHLSTPLSPQHWQAGPLPPAPPGKPLLYPYCPTMPEAAHLGDLLQIWRGYSPRGRFTPCPLDFQGASESLPEAARTSMQSKPERHCPTTVSILRCVLRRWS